MASTQGSTQADPRFDGGAAPPDPVSDIEQTLIDVEQTLARLVHASYPPDARGGGPASDTADARISQSFAAGTPGAADLGPPIPREQRSLGQRGTLARDAVAVCVGAFVIWAAPRVPNPTPEQAAARPAIEMSAPARAESEAVWIGQPNTMAANEWGPASAERKQVETNDVAALRQTVEQLAAGQEQLTREIARLQAEKSQADKLPAEESHAEKLPAEKSDKRMPSRVSARAAPPVAAPARKPAAITLMPAQAARRVSTVSALSPPPGPVPQIRSETQPSNPPPLRPPMPVP